MEIQKLSSLMPFTYGEITKNNYLLTKKTELKQKWNM